MKDIVISLFDRTGNWSRPYLEAGYTVYQIDIQNEIQTDVMTWNYRKIPKERVWCILAAVPCTDFAYSGEEWFPLKDRDGRTAKSCALVKKTMEIINYFNPEVWCIENPKGRIRVLNPEIGQVKCIFNPYQYAGYNEVNPDNYRYPKETWLYGEFTVPYTSPLPMLSKYRKTKWKDEFISEMSPIGSQELKNLRSVTPIGFAIAFYRVNEQSVGKCPISLGMKGKVLYV